MRVLFVCSMAMCRSPTGARVFSGRHETEYAGVLSTARPVTRELLEWADVVLVMEDEHRRLIGEWFPDLYLRRRIVNLGIPDVYPRDHPGLVTLLEEKAGEVLG